MHNALCVRPGCECRVCTLENQDVVFDVFKAVLSGGGEREDHGPILPSFANSHIAVSGTVAAVQAPCLQVLMGT